MNSDSKFNLISNDEIINVTALEFSENNALSNCSSDECRYGCNCITYEKCCGCLLQ